MVTRSCAVLIALLATLLVPVTGPASQAAPVGGGTEWEFTVPR